MLAKLYSYAILGLDDGLIEVEVDISQGLPAFTIVGLPNAAVQESRERIRPAEVSRLSQCQHNLVSYYPPDHTRTTPASMDAGVVSNRDETRLRVQP